jgi:SAM-dependent methyltransferase
VGCFRAEKQTTAGDNQWWIITGMADQNVTETGIAWQKTVEDEHAQSDRIREESASDDFWRPVAHRFVPPKKGEPSQDDTVECLAELITPDQTVLDVGAGGGRLVIPLAEHCVHATDVEPSEAMREQLIATAEAWDVRNIEVVASRWEEAVFDAITYELDDLIACTAGSVEFPPLRFASVGKLGGWGPLFAFGEGGYHVSTLDFAGCCSWE